MTDFAVDSSNLNNILKALNEHLAFARSPHIELVICGGSALNSLGLVERATKDIDVIAILKNGAPVKCGDFPDYFKNAARRVAEDLNLPDDWINMWPASLTEIGLPEGFFTRLHPVDYGKFLTLHFIDRLDQIYFKLYAAIDQGPASRHFQDLLKLNPKENEISGAAMWLLEQDVSAEFRRQLRQCLFFMEFKDVAGRI
jgi:hypothetical protein